MIQIADQVYSQLKLSKNKYIVTYLNEDKIANIRLTCPRFCNPFKFNAIEYLQGDYVQS